MSKNFSYMDAQKHNPGSFSNGAKKALDASCANKNIKKAFDNLIEKKKRKIIKEMIKKL